MKKVLQRVAKKLNLQKSVIDWAELEWNQQKEEGKAAIFLKAFAYYST